MEPRSEHEMTAIHGARKVATREKLRRQAEGMGRWWAIVTFVQLGLVYFVATWLEGRPSPLGIVVPFLFLVVTGNVAYVNARIDALVRLMAEDATGQ